MGTMLQCSYAVVSVIYSLILLAVQLPSYFQRPRTDKMEPLNIFFYGVR